MLGVLLIILKVVLFVIVLLVGIVKAFLYTDDMLFATWVVEWFNNTTNYTANREWCWRRFNYCYSIYDVHKSVVLELTSYEFVRYAVSLGFDNPYGEGEFWSYRYFSNSNKLRT